MRRRIKTVILLEVALCFAPTAFLLLVGMLLVPMQIYALISEPLTWQGPVYVIGSVVCGSAGLAALIHVLGRLFEPEGAIEHPIVVLAGVALGTLPLIEILATGTGWARLSAAMPLVCAAHILFLGRRMLFPWATE